MPVLLLSEGNTTAVIYLFYSDQARAVLVYGLEASVSR